MTFLEMARLRRLREGFATLAGGGKVIAAQHEASFGSASAFRAAFARHLGCAPAGLCGNGALRATSIPTPLGDMIAVASRSHLHLLEFVDRAALPADLRALQVAAGGGIGIGTFAPAEQATADLDAFFAARSARFATPLAPAGSPFARRVWDALREIPAGETCSYGEIARRIGRPTATRAVARANGAHRMHYNSPEGFEACFDGAVAAALEDFAARIGIDRTFGLILRDEGGARCGSVFASDMGAAARLRLFLIDRHLHGRGLGRAMLDAVLFKASEASFRHIAVSTFDARGAACRLYARAGFAETARAPCTAFGRRMVQIDYGLTLRTG